MNVHHAISCWLTGVVLTVLCFQMHLAGQQKMFNIFSLRSGGTYLVQVRCKPDHGFWSEWSSSSYVKVPDCKTPTNSPLHSTHLPFYSRHVVIVTLCFTDFHREKSVWILITVFCAFIFLIVTWLLHMNSRRWNNDHELLTSYCWLFYVYMLNVIFYKAAAVFMYIDNRNMVIRYSSFILSWHAFLFFFSFMCEVWSILSCHQSLVLKSKDLISSCSR